MGGDEECTDLLLLVKLLWVSSRSYIMSAELFHLERLVLKCNGIRDIGTF